TKNRIDSWVSVHNWLTNEFSRKSQPIAPIIEVENGTSFAGLAQLATNRLKDENLQVINSINAPNHDNQITTITVYDKNVTPGDLITIDKEFGIHTIKYDASYIQTGYNVLIVVENEYYTIEGKKPSN